jgi:hypothetical protein
VTRAQLELLSVRSAGSFLPAPPSQRFRCTCLQKYSLLLAIYVSRSIVLYSIFIHLASVRTMTEPFVRRFSSRTKNSPTSYSLKRKSSKFAQPQLSDDQSPHTTRQYTVGIDLGTTNSAAAGQYTSEDGEQKIFHITNYPDDIVPGGAGLQVLTEEWYVSPAKLLQELY